MAHPPMADPATAGTIASFAVLAILLALLVLLRPSLLVRHLLAPLLPGVIFRGDRQRRELALTIDDGPSPGSDGSNHTGSMALLALLRELQVPATLFVISGHLERADPAYLVEALADGHGIGHHMNEDSVSARLSSARFRQAFDQAAAQLRSVAARGCRLVLGSIFPWDTFHPPPAWMARFVLRNAHPGAILVLHDRPDTLPATMQLLRLVVPALRQRGYRFVSLNRLLNA
jgi:peptidoglycan/xylan/chitin deacetylase (PgdA/CDA1 family)